MKKLLLPFLMFLVLISCSTSKRTTSTSGTNTTTSIPKSTDDGLSYATAIVITEKSETKGVAAEYAWVKQHYDNYKVKKQALNYHDKKPYDVITINLADGKDLNLYFDISNYFGKF